jgi:2-polyprenyl-6-methoxyphenol hydroxylase-like FAD-dependent oxidoreductase
MAVVDKALVIGGGFSGCCAAIELRKSGIDVTLLEKDPGWRSYGAGLTVNGATLRALGKVGVLPRVIAEGFCADGVDIFTASGHRIAELPTPRVAGPAVPGGGGIMRPVLGRILADATRESGTIIRLGCTVRAFKEASDSVEAEFSDGSKHRFALVIGADGLNSQTRTQIFAAAPRPSFTGQGVWRAVAPRPDTVSRPAMYMGTKLKVGVNPVSQKNMYLFLTEDRATKDYIDEGELLKQLKHLLAEFSATVVSDLRERLSSASQIVYRPLEALILPLPWYKDRVVFLGDAAHATTPHLAAGAGLGVEDALVLAEELNNANSLKGALDAFQTRRFDRCSMVVKNSLRLGEIEQTGGSKEEHAQIMRDSFELMAAPI